jgi:hypothetical protein
MRFLSAGVALLTLFATTGCSQIVQLEPTDLAAAQEIKNLTIRTRTGEVYFFESARVAEETLSGFAQETKAVYVSGAQVEYVTDYRDVQLRVAQVEQATVRQRNWGKTALLVGVVAAGVAAVVLLATSSGSDESDSGDGGGGKPPLDPAP